MMSGMFVEFIAKQGGTVTVVYHDDTQISGTLLAHDELGVVIKSTSAIVFIPYTGMSCLIRKDEKEEEAK
jgi:hypothetical protein